MDDPKPEDPCGTPSGPCKLIETTQPFPPDPTQPFRRLLEDLTNRVKQHAPEPTEASTKFPDELKEAEKEFQGIEAIVAKYKDFYDKKLDCHLANVKTWRKQIEGWSTKDEGIREAIRKFRTKHYDSEERRICCENWIAQKEKLNNWGDCLAKAKNEEAQRQQAYDLLKGFLDALTKIFGELEALFKKAEANQQKAKLVFGILLEFDDLRKLIDWPKTAEERCAKPPQDGEPGYEPTQSGGGEYAQQTPPSGGSYTTPQQGGGGYDQQSETPEGYEGKGAETDGLKKRLSPDAFRARLISALRCLVLAKYQRFRWHHLILITTARAEAGKKECEKFRTDRQKSFLEEVEDIPTGSSGTGGGAGTPGGAGYQQQPPTGGGGYQQQPPTGGGGYQQQQPPPTKGGYAQEPPTKGGYPQEPPTKGGYEPQPPQGGYKKE